ncbi:LapA family protein [Methylomonas sp. LW13]|nr:LapA family protein [Methylomonas sp. LW13]
MQSPLLLSPYGFAKSRDKNMGWDLLNLFIAPGTLRLIVWAVAIGAVATFLVVLWFSVSAARRNIDNPKLRYLAMGLVLAIFLMPVAYKLHQNHLKQQALDAKLATMTKALDRYHELCKGAGEKIYRTVDDVDGVFLMKIDLDKSSDISQYSNAAKSPYESLGDFDTSSNDHEVRYMWFDGYIKSFLNDGGFGLQCWVGNTNRCKQQPAFKYVEAIDPGDGKRYRYTGSWQRHDKVTGKEWSELLRKVGYIPRELLEPTKHDDGTWYDLVLTREPAGDPPPRYGVTYDDLETPEERKMWIAGSALKVIDLQTGELLGERIGYLHDRGGGSVAGGRQPWSFAKTGLGWSCPPQRVVGRSKRDFIMDVLHTNQGVKP